MSYSAKIKFRDTFTPALRDLGARIRPERLAAAIGPRGVRLVQNHFRRLPRNEHGWPSTNFWGRAARATHWDQVRGGVDITVSQIGVRQRVYGGLIRPVKAKMLTIPAVGDAYGRTAREFHNLRFGFALNPKTGKMQAALVEAQATYIKLGRERKDGTRSVKPLHTTTGLAAIYWLARKANQPADPSVVPSDQDWQRTLDESIDALLPNK